MLAHWHAEKFLYPFWQLDLHSYIWHRATKRTTIYICNYKRRTVQVAHMREREDGVQRSHSQYRMISDYQHFREPTRPVYRGNLLCRRTEAHRMHGLPR